MWWRLKVKNETIELAVFAETYEDAVTQFEEQLQRIVEDKSPDIGGIPVAYDLIDPQDREDRD